METKFIRKHKEAENIVSFFFTKPKAFVFDAGDFTELAFDFPGENGDKRWFTIASSPEEKDIQFTMKLPPKPSKFKQALSQMKTGNKASLSPALGRFNLPSDKAEQLVFVAGGIGITPYRSMLNHLLKMNEERAIDLHYIAKSGERIFEDLLDESCASVHYEPVDFEITSVATEVKTIFLAGPEPMIKTYFETLLGAGVHRSQIKLDYFPGYTEL